MTDRVKGFVVTLFQDMREDDAEATLNALRMVKNVQSVEPVLLNGLDDAINRNRIHQQVVDKLFKVIDELRRGE